jgi:integrase
MSSVWTIRRGGRFAVLYRLGGREARHHRAGSFGTKREADARRKWVAGELAAMRVPDLRQLVAQTPRTIAQAAGDWQRSRRDVAAGTAATHDVALGRLLPRVGTVAVSARTPARVNELVEELGSLKRESIRKTLSVLAMIVDHEAIVPNPVRSPLVKLPRSEHTEVNPPTAEHLLAVLERLPAVYRLPLLVLDATGMRVGELEQLSWGDIDEPHGRWRVTAKASKTNRARWVTPPPVLLERVLELVPREDRAPGRRVFQGFGADRFRTALTRACTAAGVPAFSPHDLRHRRVSLLHAGGVSWARIGEAVGHGDIATTARIYTHVLLDETELDYGRMLA